MVILRRTEFSTSAFTSVSQNNQSLGLSIVIIEDEFRMRKLTSIVHLRQPDERWEVTSVSLAAGDTELNSNSARALPFSKKLCNLSDSRAFLPRSNHLLKMAAMLNLFRK